MSVVTTGRRFGSVTDDPSRGLALLRGRAVVDAARTLGHRPAWSASGRGWVVPSEAAADVLALAEHEHVTVAYRETGGAA